MLKLKHRKVILAVDFGINGIASNLVISLKKNDYLAIHEGNKIDFKRMIRTSTHTGENRREHAKIFREGKIELNIKGDKINIDSEVKLDSLFFMSLLIGGMCGFLMYLFLKPVLLICLLTGFIGLILFFWMGYISIRRTIGAIVDQSCKL